jgi:WD40 repeat protein
MSILFLGSFASCATPNYGYSTATKSYIPQTVPTVFYTVTASPDSATPLPPPTLTPTPINLSVTQIRAPSDTDRREVLASFWHWDGLIIYYALADDISDALLWFEIKLNNGQVIQDRQLSSPPAINYAPNLPRGLYYEYQGLISPSKRYSFQIIQTETSSLYLLDSVEQSKVKLLETPDMNFRGAYWIPGENSVVFGIGPEYGTFFYLYDIRDRKLSSFEELLGYNDPNISEWALSPDGNYVAILDGNESLKLFSLDGGFSTTVSGYLSNVRWSGNSQKIYYYFGTQHYSPTTIGYYDVATKTAIDMMPLSTLEKLGVDIGFFDVSPDGNQLVFWQAGDIWLVSFH